MSRLRVLQIGVGRREGSCGRGDDAAEWVRTRDEIVRLVVDLGIGCLVLVGAQESRVVLVLCLNVSMPHLHFVRAKSSI